MENKEGIIDIIIVGGHGSGKSTLVCAISELLRQLNFTVAVEQSEKEEMEMTEERVIAYSKSISEKQLIKIHTSQKNRTDIKLDQEILKGMKNG